MKYRLCTTLKFSFPLCLCCVVAILILCTTLYAESPVGAETAASTLVDAISSASPRVNEVQPADTHPGWQRADHGAWLWK